MENFTSKVEVAEGSQETVYGFLEDCRNFSLCRDMLTKAAENEGNAVDKEKTERLGKAEFDRDSVEVDAPNVGKVRMQITERQEPTTIRMEGCGIPLKIEMVIQLLPLEEDRTKTRLRVTLRADLNPFIRAMVGGKLSEAADKVAEQLANLPYNKLPRVEN